MLAEVSLPERFDFLKILSHTAFLVFHPAAAGAGIITSDPYCFVFHDSLNLTSALLISDQSKKDAFFAAKGEKGMKSRDYNRIGPAIQSDTGILISPTKHKIN